LYTKNNATGRFNKQVNQATANAAKKSATLTNWLRTKKNVNGLTTANNLAKAYLNGTNVPANLKGFTGNMNKNRPPGNLANPNAARNRDAFWNAVNAEMARRFKNLEAFKTYYARRIMTNEPSNQARARRYVREFGDANNAGRRAMGGAITKNNNNNANRKKNGGFWNLVGEQLASRPPA
jgi:hypothetical protein